MVICGIIGSGVHSKYGEIAWGIIANAMILVVAAPYRIRDSICTHHSRAQPHHEADIASPLFTIRDTVGYSNPIASRNDRSRRHQIIEYSYLSPSVYHFHDVCTVNRDKLQMP